MKISTQPQATQPTCRPVSRRALVRQLRIDAALRIIVFTTLCGCLAFTAGGAAPGFLPGLVIIAAAATWIGISVISVRVARDLASVTELIEEDPAGAEALLATMLRLRPLPGTLRLLVYHRLAMLRHRQRRHAESAQVCDAVLGQRTGVPREARAHLLLMLAEAQLHHRDLWGAHAALTRLHGMPLNLLESLQRLALQLLYEIQSGHDEAALARLDDKVRMAELLPASQCGLVHLMLAGAARRTARGAAARWLRARAELLSTPEQLTKSQPWNI